MPVLTIITGVALLLLGVLGYVLTGLQSWTALIPAFFGLPLGLLGLAARRPGWRKHAMHVAAVLTLLGLLGSMMGIPKIFSLIAGNEVERPSAAISQSIMALLCLIYLAMAVKSFIAARRSRGAAAQPPA